MTHKPPPETLYARRKTRTAAANTTSLNTTATATATSASASTSNSTSPLSSPDTASLANTSTIHPPQPNTTPTASSSSSSSSASSTTKPRRRGRSLRTNLLLRPHHTSPIPSPPSPITIPPSATHDRDNGDDNDGSGNVAMSGGGGRRNRTSSFILLPRQQEIESAADTAYYGFVVLGATWIVFVVGMGSALGIWEWAWDVPDSPFLKIANESDEVLIPGYYPALVILTCVMAWVWVVVAWMGMKYFKHAKIQGGGDDG